MAKRKYVRNALGEFAHTPGAKASKPAVSGKSGSSRSAPGLTRSKLSLVKTQGRLGAKATPAKSQAIKRTSAKKTDPLVNVAVGHKVVRGGKTGTVTEHRGTHVVVDFGTGHIDRLTGTQHAQITRGEFRSGKAQVTAGQHKPAEPPSHHIATQPQSVHAVSEPGPKTPTPKRKARDYAGEAKGMSDKDLHAALYSSSGTKYIAYSAESRRRGR